MTLDQLALFGIGAFAFMALAAFLNTMRTVKKISRRSPNYRIRRLIGSEYSARTVAESVIKEIVESNPELVRVAKASGHLTPELGELVDEARNYFLGRVESRHKVVFSQTVDRLIFDK